ncbi:hypothetical protein FKR81_20685 [Lentzea tibetensis]|uniref:Uncharacterized protein n=1 Tax=Lentzea tibetensis TaxID=2591470 RepID=A0A563ES64_9PSEU|nr:hypothetical protein [Lentzea tibetensis]TWP50585.1 hypothetical protein FKR81_20685 [Lentzea tibetensis]
MIRSERRLVSPAALLLALLCLGLPFVAVSCESSVATVSADYSGWDLVAGGTPDVTPQGDDSFTKNTERSEIPAQPAAIVFLVLATAAIALARTRAFDLRTLGSAVCAGGAAVMLIVNQLRVHHGIAEEIQGNGLAEDMVHTRFGFWLTLLFVLGAAACNATTYARRNSLVQQRQR